MALPAPITIADEANLLQKTLQDWVNNFGGSAAVVSNLRDWWNQAATNSTQPRILICYMGEDSRGSFSQIAPWHRVDRKWSVAVTRGRGYYANRGDSLSSETALEMPLFDVVETVREIIRSMLDISEETPSVDYRGIKPMQLGNLVVDGFSIEFTTANDIPSNLTQPKSP
jgi:hypothetical protein